MFYGKFLCIKLKNPRISSETILLEGPITLWQIDGEKVETVTDFIFLGSTITASDCSHNMKRCLLLGRKAVTNLDSILKSRDTTLPTHVHISKLWFFQWMHKLDHKQSWALKNWCFWIVVLEKTLKNPLDCKEIKSVNPKRNQTLNIHWRDWHWS